MILLGERIIRWRADKEGKFTDDEFKDYYLGLCITQEFASSNTPHQISVSERVWWTLCGMVHRMLVDSGLPPFLWGELMMTAFNLCNRIPHSARKMETPYKMFYCKDVELSHLRIIGARAFVHTKDANKLDHTLGVRFSQNESNSFPICNPKTRRVVESKNVFFIETSPHLLPGFQAAFAVYRV